MGGHGAGARVFFAFLVIQLPPGDFLDSYIETLRRSGMSVDSATLVSLRHAYGLDRPMIVQYWNWVSPLCCGDMGVSFLYVEKVNVIIAERLPWTLLITFGSMLLCTCFDSGWDLLGAATISPGQIIAPPDGFYGHGHASISAGTDVC